MIFEAAEFIFKPPPVISRARRVLIKPCASYPAPYPVSTSSNILATIISGIRQISDADILLLEGTPSGAPVRPIYQALSYNFPRVLTLDVKDCTLVEVDNPLPKPFVIPTFWIPNVILSSDYLISVSPLKITNGIANLSIMNLLSLLPTSKYRGDSPGGWGTLYELGIDKVLADLYFTLPSDLGVIEGTQTITLEDDPTHGEIHDYGKILVGEPYDIDREVSQNSGLKAEYLDLIKTAKVELDV